MSKNNLLKNLFKKASTESPAIEENRPEEQKDQPTKNKSGKNSYGAILAEANAKRKARIQRLKDEQSKNAES